MIIGSCPYEDCDGPLFLPLADDPLPRLEKHDCESCGRVIWTKHSRWNPWSMTEVEFLKEYAVDEETHIVTTLERTA